jgi:hypothetical protein
MVGTGTFHQRDGLTQQYAIRGAYSGDKLLYSW